MSQHNPPTFAGQPLGYSVAQRREAAEWFIVIQDETDPEAETLQAWLRWMEADEAHRTAFEAVSAAWHHTSPSAMVAMPTAQELADDDYDGDVSVEQWLTSKQLASQAARAKSSKFWDGLRRGVIAAAAVMAWIAVGWFFYGETQQAPSWGVFETRVGEHRELTLADGSRISLGAKSRLSVNFHRGQRELRLETGEAFFEVAKDPERPFVVRAMGGSITALGTAFDVRAVRDSVTVMVAEGIVSVRSPAVGAGEQQANVSPRQQVTFDLRGREPLVVQAAPNLEERLRWREGWLIYRNEPLGNVIADVSRYTERRMEVSDHDAATLRFSGAVYRESVDEWLLALPEAFPVTIEALERRERKAVNP
ncbi:FecR family protein [Steroidobacter sp.]|uniref:FecR family protein n=1 Tax=Steroidobacter sp. TaxID=1978227 RepID=UPI001A588D80|nr:FecR domain-containing protein [Steroidobacter sp.]MBL8266699.1 FecR domain-containing protein [Steroidobacter sp.]